MIKYPKTPYLPWSPSVDKDDPIADPNNFIGKSISISIKMDGSNIAMTRGGVYGRSEHHPSMTEIKAKHGTCRWMIPEGEHIFGESLVAKHAIHYKDKLALEDIFQVFNVYNENLEAFYAVRDVQKLCDEIGLRMVRYLIYEPSSVERLKKAVTRVFDKVVEWGHEGVVIRNASAFRLDRFSENIAKMVRPHHVQTQEHWSNLPFVKNEIRTKAV